MPEVPLLNHYPSTVRNASFGARSGCRATVTEDRFDVWELVAGTPERTVSLAVTSFTPAPGGRQNRSTPAVVETTEGERWEILLGCAPCSGGNKLKSFNPFGVPNRVGT